ncbi:MAG TPA: hypothetical protein VGK73_18165 [Polyangiaceae bacterium]
MSEHAAAAYYVLYRLSQQGFSATPKGVDHAELVACTADGDRVAVLRLRTRGLNGRFMLRAEDRRPAGRNVSYVFVDLSGGEGGEPRCFVLRSALLLAMLEVDSEWPRDARSFQGLEDCRDAWHLLGLGTPAVVRSQGVLSPS